MSKETGLEKRFSVLDLDDVFRPVDAIVLEWSDPLAREGIAAWALAVRAAGYDSLFIDLRDKLAIYSDTRSVFQCCKKLADHAKDCYYA